MTNLRQKLAFIMAFSANDGRSGAMTRIWKLGPFGMGVKRMMYERRVVPTVAYRAETLCLNVKKRRRLNVMQMNCLRKMCGVNIHG